MNGHNDRIQPITLAGLAVALLVSANAAAQSLNYPTKPVRIIVTSGPGVVTDLNARLVAGKLSAMWGQPVVVENKVGGNAIIGTDAMVKSAPDGRTLLLTTTGIVQNPATRLKDLPYDTERDIAPVTQMFIVRIMYAVDAKLPANTIGEFLGLAKASPGKFNFGSYGTGSTAHLLATKLNRDSWAGLFAPGATPERILNKISSDVAAVMAMPDVRGWYQDATIEPASNTPAEFRAIIKRDIDYWRSLVTTTGMKVD